MRPRSRILLLGLVTMLALALALVLLLDRPATRSGTGTTTAGGDERASAGFDGALLPGGVRARSFTLTDQRGRRISLRQYRGRVAILTFLSPACRPTCPLVAQQIRGALDELHEPVPVLIVSADPAADSPLAVRRFLAEASLSGRVEYLTGTLAELRPVWQAYGVVPAQLAAAGSSHPASVLLIDRGGFERDLFEVEQLTPEGLAHDVRGVEGEG
jgi:cytochrome oxidase Cu insertion factor (SCO1/SenC/PrrC family)